MPVLRRGLSTVRIGAAAVNTIIAETTEALPLETGGMLIGYWGPGTSEAVVLDVIGPGPAAMHTRAGFLPDGEWQQQQLEEVYHRSGRIHTFLGDWHSHPHGDASPSARDRQTARAVASEGEARTPHPITLILAVTPALVLSALVRRRRKLIRASIKLF